MNEKNGMMMAENRIAPGELVRILKKSDKNKTDSNVTIGYQVRGRLLDSVEIGRPIKLWRTERNGDKVLGLFTSSHVESIERLSDVSWIIRTLNSEYELEVENGTN